MSNYFFIDSRALEKINKTVEDKCKEFAEWLDTNSDDILKSDYGIQFIYTSEDRDDDFINLDGRSMLDDECELHLATSMLINLYLKACKSGYIAPKEFLNFVRDEFYEELSKQHPTKKTKKTRKKTDTSEGK